MKNKLFAIALLLVGASCFTLVSCDGNKKNDKDDKDTTVVITPADGSTTDTIVHEENINVHVDTTGHSH